MERELVRGLSLFDPKAVFLVSKEPACVGPSPSTVVCSAGSGEGC